MKTMNYFSMGLGFLCFLYGLITFYLRNKRPERFKKLGSMKSFWGDKTGYIIHFLAYTIVPVIVGLYFIYSGIHGISIFGDK